MALSQWQVGIDTPAALKLGLAFAVSEDSSYSGSVIAGYSGTPLAKKLGIKAGFRIALIHPPSGFEQTPGPVPEGVKVLGQLEPSLDLVVFFTHSRAEYEQQFAPLKAALKPNAGLWVAWPKRASKVISDLTEDGVRSFALEHGLVDNKVCAIDPVYSGLRLVYRLKDRVTLTIA